MEAAHPRPPSSSTASSAEVTVRHLALLILASTLTAAALQSQERIPATIASVELPSVTLPPELDRVLRDYERAWSQGDAEGLARLFTEDGFVPRPQGWTRGRAAILDAYASTGGDLRLRAHAFATSGTVGWIAGSYGYAEEAALRDMGRFLLALRRESGDAPWRIAADLDHGNQGTP